MGAASEILAWPRSLDSTFAFLPALPFVVAAAAFPGEWLRRHRDANSETGVVSKELTMTSGPPACGAARALGYARTLAATHRRHRWLEGSTGP